MKPANIVLAAASILGSGLPMGLLAKPRAPRQVTQHDLDRLTKAAEKRARRQRQQRRAQKLCGDCPRPGWAVYLGYGGAGAPDWFDPTRHRACHCGAIWALASDGENP